MKILLTGATGFVGSWIAEEILGTTAELYSLERITARPNPLAVFSSSINHIYHDFCSPLPARILRQLEGIDYIIHCGAEVHGLRSLENPERFVQANVIGTLNLLEAARVLKPQKFIYISSAEVLGSISNGSLNENSPLKPSNPYAAAKASGEMLVKSYWYSYQVPTVTIRTMNVFGERQDSSKFIPATIKKMIAGEPIILHVGRDGKSGSRHWLHVQEFVHAVYQLAQSSVNGYVYHIIGPERTNADIIAYIGYALHIPFRQVAHIPNFTHEMRYSAQDNFTNHLYDCSVSKMVDDLVKTVKEYKTHPEWLK